jgi:hypothetical protein
MPGPVVFGVLNYEFLSAMKFLSRLYLMQDWRGTVETFYSRVVVSTARLC